MGSGIEEPTFCSKTKTPYTLKLRQSPEGLSVLFETYSFFLEIKKYKLDLIQLIRVWLTLVPVLVSEFLSAMTETRLHRMWYEFQLRYLKEPFCYALTDLAKGSFESGNLDPFLQRSDLIYSILQYDFMKIPLGEYRRTFSVEGVLIKRCFEFFHDPRIYANFTRLNKNSWFYTDFVDFFYKMQCAFVNFISVRYS